MEQSRMFIFFNWPVAATDTTNSIQCIIDIIHNTLQEYDKG